MFFQLLFIHLYRPFLKYNRTTSPLPSHVSPRKFCTQAAGAISKLLRLYKRTHGLRQICNIAVYIAHSACTIHLLNLPDKNAKRDIIHGVKHLEEIGECWTCARRTLRILNISAERWKIELPEEALATFSRTRAKWGTSDPAVSPTGFPDILPQSNSKNMSSATSRNSGDRRSGGPHKANVQSSIPQNTNGLFTSSIQSPAPTPSDNRRSSSGFSLPPQSASDFYRSTTRPRPSMPLTQAQQDAWNAHQATRKGPAADGSGNAAPLGNNANAAILFGGVESLVEESQDWWLKDQSSLALGFDNWLDPSTDWAGLGLSSSGGLNGPNGSSTSNTITAFNGTSYPYPDNFGNGHNTFRSTSAPEINGSKNLGLLQTDNFDDEMYF